MGNRFENTCLKKLFGLKPLNLQRYNFERYSRYNNNLTESTYQYLRQNGAEWKILCGLGVTTHWGSKILEEVWWLKRNNGYMSTDFYKFRFTPEKYLELSSW